MGHAHYPIDTAELIVTTIAGVIEVLHERVAMKHQLPRAALAVEHVHWRDFGQPRGPRAFASVRHRPVRHLTVILGLTALLARRRLPMVVLFSTWRRGRRRLRRHRSNGRRR